jgi:hypothetical protein
MKLLFPKQNYNDLSPSSYTHISVRNLYVSRIGLKYVDQSWKYKICSQAHECGNWDWGRAIPGKGKHKWDYLCSVEPGCVIAQMVVLWLAGINESHLMKV